MILNDNDRIVQKVEGIHLNEKTNADVTALNIVEQNYPRILKNIENFFPHLIAILWDNSGLEEISAADFRPFPRLRLIRIWCNNLTSIEH